MDQATAAILGALIGATGAVLGQIVAALFTARREAKRLSWEQESARLKLADELLSRFTDIRRTLFGEYLSEASLAYDKAKEWYRDGMFNREIPGGYESARTFIDAWYTASERRVVDMQLLAPEVALLCKALNATILTLGDFGIEPRQRESHHFDEGELISTEELMRDCQTAMRKDLGLLTER
jgi:hypothetical protein